MAHLPDEIYNYIVSHFHPSPLDSWEPVTRASLGSIEIFNIAEACYEVDPGFAFSPDHHSELPLVDGRLSLMRFGLCLVKLPNSTNVILDASVGPWLTHMKKCSGHPTPEKPPHALDETLKNHCGLGLGGIHFVIHSHCHGDHVGWVGQFPNAVHVLHNKEYEFAQYAGCPWRQDALSRFEPLQEQGRLLLIDGEDNIVIDKEKCPQLSAFLCAGHTPGHIAIKIQDDEPDSTSSNLQQHQVAYYIGDALHFAFQVSNPDLSPLFDCCGWKMSPFAALANVEQTWMPAMRNNPKWGGKTSSEARRALLQKIADQNSLLVSPHFSPPGMGTVEDSGDGQFVYMPVATK